MTQVQLRPAIPADFVSIVALERATEYAPHWAPATYADMLSIRREASRSAASLSLSKGRRTRWFRSRLFLHSSIAELESVVVSTKTRRRGIGRALCTAVLDWARTQGATEVILEVRATSTAPIALYTALGFQQTGRRPRYYRDPADDALAMRLEL